MGTYCGLRFKDVVLNVNEPLIEKWLGLSLLKDTEKLSIKDENMDNLVWRIMGTYDKINMMPNTIFDFTNAIEKLEDGNLKLNIVISCKNLTNEFEMLFLYIKRYIVSGELYHSYESEVNKVDIKGNVAHDIDPTGTINYYLPYINVKDITSKELEDMENEIMFGDIT